MSAAIVTTGLTKQFGEHLALDRLDLTVEPGEIFGFLGPNGAGKTTTIRLLLDLIRPTAGFATIQGIDCQRESHRVRAITGYLPGEIRFFSGLTGRETVEFVAGLRSRDVDHSYVFGMADRLGLDLDRHVSVYSKGNRQKLGILLALLDKPSVLLLDEPTSGLDPLIQQVVWDMLREASARGAAIFFSSHVMSEVEQVCQRVAILRAGRLVAVEPITRLKERALRRIEVTVEGALPPRDLALPGVHEVARRGSVLTYEVAGVVDPLLKRLADCTVLDLRTEQPSLDDILLSMYKERAA